MEQLLEGEAVVEAVAISQQEPAMRAGQAAEVEQRTAQLGQMQPWVAVEMEGLEEAEELAAEEAVVVAQEMVFLEQKG